MTKEEFQDLAIDSSDIDEIAEKMYPMTTTPPTPIEVAAYHNAAQQKLRDAFKAGVKWSKEQMIKITKDNNLDEAAEKYAIQGHENHTNVNYINTYIEGKRIGFIAGAEWQKEQDDKLVDIIYQQGIEKGKDEMMETLKKNEK